VLVLAPPPRTIASIRAGQLHTLSPKVGDQCAIAQYPEVQRQLRAATTGTRPSAIWPLFDGAWYDTQYLEVTNGLSSRQNAYNVSNASLTWTASVACSRSRSMAATSSTRPIGPIR
jgi:hypothetical protein